MKLKTKGDKFYMNLFTGTVQTGDDWQADCDNDASESWENVTLVEVEKVNGEWLLEEQ